MKIIKFLSDKIEDELNDSCSYIDAALQWKESEPDTAEVFYELSLEEMKHMERLHNEVVEIIRSYRENNGDPPKEMMALYNYLHEKHSERAMTIRVKQGLYKS